MLTDIENNKHCETTETATNQALVVRWAITHSGTAGQLSTEITLVWQGVKIFTMALRYFV